MPSFNLPDRPSLEYLKKLAKERLQVLRRENPTVRLADMQLAIAREYGFPGWRALKEEVEQQDGRELSGLITALRGGNIDRLRDILLRNPTLANARTPEGSPVLHQAVKHVDAVELLLEHGADPNARDKGDNALALHFAAGAGVLGSVEALLNAGSDVQGTGDAHRLDTIGWATCFAEPHMDVVDLLVQHGAKHHIFSAIALNDLDLISEVIGGDRRRLARRLSQHEQLQTALHFVVAPPDGLVGGTFRTGSHYDMLDLLIELGASIEAVDAKGRTPLALAMVLGDEPAMQILYSAGATMPDLPALSQSRSTTDVARSVKTVSPMIGVPDVAATVAWYQDLGFELCGSHGEDDEMDWAAVSFGATELMFVPSKEPTTGLSLWFLVDRLDDWYSTVKMRRLEHSRAALLGEESDGYEIPLIVDLHTAFYGQREFGLRDPNGIELFFYRPIDK